MKRMAPVGALVCQPAHQQLTRFEQHFLKQAERLKVWRLQLEILNTTDFDHQCDLVDELRKVTRHAMAAPTLHSKKAIRELSTAYARTASDAHSA